MPPFSLLTIDIGTSSVRALLFDSGARQIAGVGAQRAYRVTTTPDGGVEIDPDDLVRLSGEVLDEVHQQLEARGMRPGAVACCTFWHTVAGVRKDGEAATPVVHLFDTRSTAEAKELAQHIDGRAQHARTGCVLHPSYVPAKTLWLSKTMPEAFASVWRWMSVGGYLFFRLFGREAESTSMVSGTGLWNQNANDYDAEMLEVLPLRREQLADPGLMDEPCSGLAEPWRSRLPLLDGIPWFPALGDGACNNIGSGCIDPTRFSLMVGTSGAMRAVVEAESTVIPEGLWCYRVDRRRFVLGGALSNGGEVFAWMKRTLALPPEDQIESELAHRAPGSHGLTLVPLFAGERATKFRSDARAAIAGMSLHTGPMEILHAGLEAVSLRFRNLYEVMRDRLGEPAEVIASGGALLRSPAWTQMMADALSRPVVSCLEHEASARGAALMALERLGWIGSIAELPPALGGAITPLEANRAAYDALLARQRRFYQKLFEETW